MTDSGKSSWDDVIKGLQAAAAELRSAMGRQEAPSAEEIAAEARLRRDLSQLQASAAELQSKLGHDIGQRRKAIASSFDKSSAERSASHLRLALEELSVTAANLAADVAVAASTSIKHAEPDLKRSVGALEEVAGSAAAWFRAAFESENDRSARHGAAQGRPLDDL